MRSFSATTKATLTLLGTMMGAGLFALPAAFSRVGWAAGSLGFFLVTGLVLSTHLIYATVFLRDSTRHRLPGLVKRELGAKPFALAAISHPLHLMGAHVAYLMLGAGFLQQLLHVFGYSLPDLLVLGLFFILNASLIQYGWRSVAKIEALATWLLIVGMVSSIAILSATKLLQPVASVSLLTFWQPFGIFLFALSGFPVIGEVVQIAQQPRSVYRAVLFGTLGAAILSWAFATVFSAATGDQTGSIQILGSIFPQVVAWLFPMVGLLAITTSYITTATELIEGFRGDYRWSARAAFLSAVLPPLCVTIFLGQRLLLVTSVIGTVFCGMNGVLIALIASQVFKRDKALIKYRPFALLTALIYTIAMFIRLSAWLV